MVRTTLTRMRGHVGRLVAAGLATAIATAFVTAFALGTNAIRDSAHNAALAPYAGADVLLSNGALTTHVLGDVRQAAGVAGADGRFTTFVVLDAAGRSDTQEAAPLPETPELRVDLADGHYPDAPGEVMVTETIAERLGLQVGSPVDVGAGAPSTDDGSSPPANSGRCMVPPCGTGGPAETVTGIFEHPGAAFDADIPGIFGNPQDVIGWSQVPSGLITYTEVVVQAAPGTSPDELRSALAPLAYEAGAVIRTTDQYAADVTAQFTAGQYILVPVLAGFVAVALFVAGMVISNTFSVLVAQRTRELALLRCVGATRRQIRANVLAEAAVLGVAASVAGTAAGVALIEVTLRVLDSTTNSVWLPDRLGLPVLALLAPPVVGVVMTLAAAWSPARRSTRVAPLAALRPVDAGGSGSRVSAARAAVTAGCLVVGGLLLVVGVLMTFAGDTLAGLAAGVLGGAVSFTGVGVGTVVLVPRMVAVLGRVVAARGGVAARIATLNAVRHPHRTASTTVALLIGVTLVVMMSVGAASARATFDRELERRYPVDVAVGLEPSIDDEGDPVAPGELDSRVTQAVAGVDGVTAAARVRTTIATFDRADNATRSGPPQLLLSGRSRTSSAGRLETIHVDVYGVDPAMAADVVRTGAESLRPGVAVVPDHLAMELDVRSGDRLLIGSREDTVELTVAVVTSPETAVLVDDADLAQVAASAPVSRVWLKLADHADADSAVQHIRDVVSETGADGANVTVAGAGAERHELSEILDTMLMVVIGLLAVAVVIALIGVSNTLSLSVIERTRESATLRALGLTRRQLRAMLAVEGVLVAVAGAGLGVLLGLIYGWLGTLTALGGVWETVLSVPWQRLLVVLATAVVAGLVASVLPGRRAARAAPVAALNAGVTG